MSMGRAIAELEAFELIEVEPAGALPPRSVSPTPDRAVAQGTTFAADARAQKAACQATA